MLASDILKLIDGFAPFRTALGWDNSGFQVGDPGVKVKKAALSLDATPAVVEEAVRRGAQLLITHHPLIFTPLKRITRDLPNAEAVFLAVKNNLTVISAHTNLDFAGVADALAEVLELTPVDFLEPVEPKYLKLVLFLPTSFDSRELMKAVFATGAGTLGDYDRCFYKVGGKGHFRALENASPFVRSKSSSDAFEEDRVEILMDPSQKDKVTKAIMAHHPYEEPAYEFYEVEHTGRHGLGLVGKWDPPKAPLPFAAKKLGLDVLARTSRVPARAETVALLPGSLSSDAIRLAKDKGAEVLITGEFGHHKADEADRLGLGLIGAGHMATEAPAMPFLKKKLEELSAKERPKPEFFVIPGESPISHFTTKDAAKPPETPGGGATGG
ncbi:MAG: Nif3-like dinuclear metal center hexameric protein [Deltaproteobacteria bacterium]|jgi:dinuclear metal center YbgI/SA1388 family protein|nr:Nif3-like dinuclear metal center hexameric protein [Deltaproteobacteria bacterium]